MLKKQEISDKFYNELYPASSRPGILYGLCKIHKSIVDGVPLFPSILPAIGTPTYELAKCFDPLLEPLTLLKIHFRFVKNFSTLTRI